MYRVIEFFTDLQDNNYAYKVGDEFPRHGLNVSEERIRELSGSNNKRHMPLIVAEKKAPAEKPPVPKEDASDKTTGVNEGAKEKTKRKPRKGREKDD